jgi:hypothetical protein
MDRREDLELDFFRMRAGAAAPQTTVERDREFSIYSQLVRRPAVAMPQQDEWLSYRR